MKRIRLKQPDNFETDFNDLPEDLTEYIARLKLLHHVPFSYLIADENMLPAESLRFFHIDGNWTGSLTEGALSIGRDTVEEAEADKARHMFSSAARQLRAVRRLMMHENHRKHLNENDMLSASDIQTGFIMRSVLTRRMKGLEVTGKNANTPLEILRLETLASDIIICIFDGELTNLTISEPKTGLRFGSPNNRREIHVRSITEDDSFGEFLDGVTVNLNLFTEASGKLNIAALAGKLGEILDKKDLGSAETAFQLIATAHRVEFIKSE